jgi:uncharacterized protein YjbI with pentapeptide repeats
MRKSRRFRSPFGHMRRNVVAYLALFVALGGTSAYAANEWTGANIVDGSLTGVDLKDASVAGRDVTDSSLTGADISESLTGADVATGGLRGSDIADGSLGNLEIANESLTSGDIKNDSLTGADINEASLNLPQNQTTATFAGVTGGQLLPEDGSMAKVASKNLPAGSYALIGTANTTAFAWSPFGSTHLKNAVCELRNGGGFIGGAHDRRVIPNGDTVFRSLTMTGGAQVPAGGGEVSMWCRGQGDETVNYGHIMVIRLDGFN